MMTRIRTDGEAVCSWGQLRPAVALLLLALGLTSVASAEPSLEVYVSAGEHGEVSFSDVAAPDAERVELEIVEPLDDPSAVIERRIEQTLAVANALEASRLEREKARAEARAEAAAARAEAAPDVVYRDRYVSYPPVLGHRFDQRFRGFHAGPGRFEHKRRFDDRFDKRHDGRRDRPDRPRHEDSRSRLFLYDPD